MIDESSKACRSKSDELRRPHAACHGGHPHIASSTSTVCARDIPGPAPGPWPGRTRGHGPHNMYKTCCTVMTHHPQPGARAQPAGSMPISSDSGIGSARGLGSLYTACRSASGSRKICIFYSSLISIQVQGAAQYLTWQIYYTNGELLVLVVWYSVNKGAGGGGGGRLTLNRKPRPPFTSKVRLRGLLSTLLPRACSPSYNSMVADR